MTKKTFNYGYVIVGAATIILMVVYSTYFSYSIFFDSLSAEFNSTKGTISGAFSLAVLFSGMLSIFAGGASDRFGPKAVCLVCGTSLGAGLLLMSRVSAVWQVYVIYGVFVAIGVGGLFPAVISTIARWFTAKRGMMLGIATSGLGVGSVILSPMIGVFITEYGWRKAYVIIGIIVLVVVYSAAMFIKRQPPAGVQVTDSGNTGDKKVHESSQDFTFREAVRTRQFWMLVIIYLLSGYGQFSLMVHVVTYATGMGIEPVAAAGIVSVYGGASIFGRLIIGGIGDKIKIKTLFISIMLILLAALVGLQYARSLWALFAMAVVFGIGYGGSSTSQSLVVVEMFGLKSMGVILGTFIFSVCIGGSTGPIITGLLYDKTGSYTLPFWIGIITALAGTVLVLWLTIPKKRTI